MPNDSATWLRRLLPMEGGAAVLANAGWLSSDRLVRMVVGLGLHVWLARSLGPDLFGLLNFCLAWVALFSPLATLGLEGIVVRDILAEPAQEGEIVVTALALRVAGGLLALGVAVVAMATYRPDQATLILTAVVGLSTVFQATEALEAFFQARLKSSVVVRSKGIAYVLAVVAKVALLAAGAPLLALAAVSVGELMVGGAALASAYGYSTVRGARARPSLLRARSLLRDSWPLLISSALTMVYMRFNQIMLVAMSSVAEVGRFSAASSLSEAWFFVPTAICASLFPLISPLKQTDPELFRARTLALYRTMVTLCLIVAVPVTLLANPVCRLLFGEAFGPVGPVLMIQIWAGLFVSLGVARSTFLTAMNWTRFHLISVGLGSLTSLALNLLLIPKYGAVGAALASVGAYWMAAHGACLVDKDLWPTFALMSRALVSPLPWRWR